MRLPYLIVGLLALAAITLTNQAFAQQTHDTLSAGLLEAGCSASAATVPKDVSCEAYFRGLTDGLWIMQLERDKQERTCLPKQTPISIADARNIFAAWLKEHPETASNSAGIVAAMAIVRAYPCGQ